MPLNENPLMTFLSVQDKARAGSLAQQHADLQTAGVLSSLQDKARARESEQALKAALASGDMNAVARINPQAAGVLANLQHTQAQTGEIQRQNAFYSPQNMAQFQTPGTPGHAAETASPDVAGPPSPQIAPTPPTTDLRGMALAGAAQGIKGTEPLLNHLAQRDQAQATMQQTAALSRERIQRDYDLARQRAEDKALSDADRIAARQDAIRLAAALRNPPAPIQSDQGLFDRGPGGKLIPLMGPNGETLKPAASGRIDLSQASQLQRQLNQTNKPMAENLMQVGMYDQARSSGDTAQAAMMAAAALRQSSRSNNRALKGDVEKMLGSGYGSGNIADRVENFIANELSGSPSDATLKKLDMLVRSSEDANLSGLAVNLNNAANQARARGLPLAHVAVPFQRGKKVAFPDGNVATFQTPAAAQSAINTWIENNQ